MSTNADWAIQGDQSVPAFAGPIGGGAAIPGWIWTTEIPADLAAAYTGFDALVAVELAWGLFDNVYDYRGVIGAGGGGSNVVTGTVNVGSQVIEKSRSSSNQLRFMGRDVSGALWADGPVLFGPFPGPAGIVSVVQCQGGFDFTVVDDITDMRHTGISLSRGDRAFIASQANSAAIGAEAAVLTTASFTPRDDRAYEFRFGGNVVTSAANTTTFQIRKTNAAGAIVAAGIPFVVTAAQTNRREGVWIARNNTGADIASYAVCLTMAASAGTSTQNGAAQNPRWLVVRDIGDATQYPNAIALA